MRVTTILYHRCCKLTVFSWAFRQWSPWVFLSTAWILPHITGYRILGPSSSLLLQALLLSLWTPRVVYLWRTKDSKLQYHASVVEKGSSVIKMPAEVLDSGKKQWEWSLVGRYMGEAPHFKLLQSRHKNIEENSQVIVAKKGKFFVYQLANENLMRCVPETGLWFVNGHLNRLEDQ